MLTLSTRSGVKIVVPGHGKIGDVSLVQNTKTRALETTEEKDKIQIGTDNEHQQNPQRR